MTGYHHLGDLDLYLIHRTDQMKRRGVTNLGNGGFLRIKALNLENDHNN